MMIPAAGSGRQVSQTASLPPPTGGWNARDALYDMAAGDAVQLDNYVAGTANVYLRNGSLKYAYYVGQLTAFTRNTTGTYFDSSGVMQTAAINVPRYTWYDPSDLTTKLSIAKFWVDTSFTNYCLYSRDLSNAAWTATNVTAAHTATGLDGSANSASLITATANNGTVTQAITAASGQLLSFYVKRVTGTGAFSYTVDGSTYATTSVTSTTNWLKISYTTAGGINPTIGFKLGTSGDAFIIDCVGVATKTNYMPVPTTSASVTIGADTPTYSTNSTSSTVGSPTETLFSYASGSVTKLMAAAAGCIYDITNGGTIGLPMVTGFTSNRWQYENMNGYIIAFNGADTPQKFDGTSWASNSITGPSDSTKLIYPCLFKHRLWVVEKNTLNAWYLGTDAITGAATQFDFSRLCHLGGSLVAIGTWTRDGGAGMDDFFVAVTNRGEVIVYQGTDPASSTTWSLVGVYRIGSPIGNRPLVQYGSDLVIICQDGFVPLSKALPLARDAVQTTAISDKIRQAATDATTLYKNNFGWEALLYPQSNWLIFNIPIVENATQYQYIMNTLNNSWCRFTGMNASCWTLYKDSPYFATTNGFVCEADTGSGDDNCSYTSNALNYIDGDIKPAFQYFKSRSSKKHFKAVRPVIASNAAVSISFAVCVDFGDNSPTLVNTPKVTGTAWDVSPWDTSPWSTASIIRKSWLTATGDGYCATTHFKTSTSGVSIALNSIDWLYEQGGVM